MSAQSARVLTEFPEGQRMQALPRLLGGKPIDLVYLARQSLGDKKLETELLTLFERQAIQVLKRLNQMGASGDRRWQSDLAHTLTGSSRAVGAFAVAAASEAYDAMLQTSAAEPELAKALQILDEEVVIACAAIHDLFG